MKVDLQPGQTVMTALLGSRPEKREELHQTLGSLLERIREQPGCLDCLVGEDLEEGARFHLHLVWKDDHALQAFIDSEVFRILHGAVNVLASATEFRMVAAQDTLSLAEWVHRHQNSRHPTRQPSPP